MQIISLSKYYVRGNKRESVHNADGILLYFFIFQSYLSPVQIFPPYISAIDGTIIGIHIACWVVISIATTAVFYLFFIRPCCHDDDDEEEQCCGSCGMSISLFLVLYPCTGMYKFHGFD